MAVGFYYYISLVLIVIWKHVQSQLNTTNATTSQTTISPNATVYFTTISPTSPTNTPSYAPTIEGCSALHGYVQTSLPNIGDNGQISSFPLRYGPHEYRIHNISIYTFPRPPSTEPDPCIISNFNTQDVHGKVVLIDATVLASINCNYQQWTLNFENLGAKAVLIGVNKPFSNYNGDNNLASPRIATRFIDRNDLSTINNQHCNLTTFICDGPDVQISLDCFTNTAPALICIEDMHYGRDDFYRINGQYEQELTADNNGHPIWKQDPIYNIGTDLEWQIQFSLTYFNWVIYNNAPGVVAYCNDTISDNPTDCTQWHTQNKISHDFISSFTLLISDGLCPTPDSNANTSNYCIRSEASSMHGITGTYTQLLQGVPEYFYTDTLGIVSILYWSSTQPPFLPPGRPYYPWGWVIYANGPKMYCNYSDTDISISNPYIRYRPALCDVWLDAATGNMVDHTFDIDANVCEMDIDSTANMICVKYATDNINLYSVWSGVYVITSEIYVNNHRVWRFSMDNKMYNILYYELNDAWIITEDDYNTIITSNIIAMCVDKQAISSNPMLCNHWVVMGANNDNNNGNIIFTVIATSSQCEVPITTTTGPTVSVTTTIKGGVAGAGGKTGLAGFGIAEYAAIGAALLAFPLCIVCFVCYQKRKQKKGIIEDEGISLQPYVPTGMAYDSYKQNQTHQQQAKKKEAEKAKKKMKTLKAPTSVASASVDVPETDNGTGESKTSTVDSNAALMGVNVFDEDDAIQPSYETNAVGLDNDNPFLRDDIIRTGQTMDETHASLHPNDIMSAFDE